MVVGGFWLGCPVASGMGGFWLGVLDGFCDGLAAGYCLGVLDSFGRFRRVGES